MRVVVLNNLVFISMFACVVVQVILLQPAQLGRHWLCIIKDLLMLIQDSGHLDLKADIPGTFEASPSCAYLYYENDVIDWVEPNEVEVLIN